MKRTLPIQGLLLAFALVASLGCSGRIAIQDQPAIQDHWRKLIILHTNDIHGQLLPLPATWIKDRDPVPDTGGVARLAAYVNMVRAQAAADGDELLVLDAGDWFQGTPEGGLDNGLPFLEMLGEVGYDAMAVGNHEFDHGVAELESHLAALDIPALLANTSEPSGSFLKGTVPYLIVERAGIRIAIVGLLTLDTPSITHHSASTLFWADPAKVLRSLMEDLEGDVDWILPLTHLGFRGDKELVQSVPGLPLVIGGHSHTVLTNGHRTDDGWIVQAGSKARGIGRLEVWIDPDSRTLERIDPSVVDLLEEAVVGHRNAKVEELSQRLLERSEERMNVVVGRLNQDLIRGKAPFQTSSQGNWVTDIMRAHTGADVALQNRGGLRSNLGAGPISRRDIFRMLPFNNAITVLIMSGSELESLMERTVEGEHKATLEMSGMEVFGQRKSGSWTMTELRIGGQEVDPTAMYRVAINSFLAGGGDGFEEFTFVKERTKGGPIQRDVVEEVFLASESGITPPTENRYRFGTN
ncbi:MAG: bifunctional UDP-sugar hydrolase/5'-nucleotidase [Planctomycetota bacterium]|nr:bifunctional UDP-sugar hydrolase/5'-nucleotidase [Planctomycetota bacterium]